MATGPVADGEYSTLAENYDRILAEGHEQLEKHNKIYGHKASDSGKLLKRLEKRRDEYLLFAETLKYRLRTTWLNAVSGDLRI